MSTKREHPCARFQRGEVHDFTTAMDVYLEQYYEEMKITREVVHDYPGDPLRDAKAIAEQSEGLIHIEKMVEQARSMYKAYVEAAIRHTVQVMRANGDYHLGLIADALESGNYEGLSV